jgi:predicted nucleotidyltransferase
MPEKLDFITPTSLKVLEHFFEHPTSEYHEREVMRATGISKGSANQILRRLAGLALLRRAEKGRMVFYSLAAEDAFVRQMKAAGNVWALRPLIESLKEMARKMILFGSCAQGTDAEDSDIDILIVAREKDRVKEWVSAYARSITRALSPLILDMDEFAALRKEDKPLFERIDRGIILWETA